VSTPSLVIVGDCLLDRDVNGDVARVCPDAPVPVLDERDVVTRPGGAGLAALLAERQGAEVTLVTAIGEDAAGEQLRALLAESHIRVIASTHDGPTVEKIRLRSAGQSLLRLDRGGKGGQVRRLTAPGRDAIVDAEAVLVADYGGGMTAESTVRAALERRGRRNLVWDPHPRGASPVPLARLVTPNRREAVGDAVSTDAAIVAQARRLREQWRAHAVAVTLGARGALCVEGSGAPLFVPAVAVPQADPCGAGDCFAVAASLALADGALVSEAVERAVDIASRFVAYGLRPAPTGQATQRVQGAEAIAADVRARGGTVVATGGCFDLLHAGHVGMLAAARRLGDCLIVLLNSDESVRRLKGAGRPLQNQHDRAALLLALECVDAVEIFDEETPITALRRLQPHLFAKGADYAVADLPESAALAEWDGVAVVLPYLRGRSTTQLVKEAVRGCT